MTEKLQKHLQGETRAAVESDLYPGEIGFNNYETELELIIQDKVTEGNYYHFPSLESDAMFTGGLGLNKTLPDFTLTCTDTTISADQVIGNIYFATLDSSPGAAGNVGQISVIAKTTFDPDADGCLTYMTFYLNNGPNPESLVEVLRLDESKIATFAGSATVSADLGVNGNATFADDIYLNSDGGNIFFGVDNEVWLLHVPDTGLYLNSEMKMLFGGFSQYITDADGGGTLRVVGNTTVEIEISDVNKLAINNTTATFSTNLILPDGVYIGTSDTDAIQIEAEGNVVLSQNLSIAGSFAVQGGGVLAAGDGYADYSTARLSPDSIAGRHIITVTPSDDSHDYFALSDKVDGQMVVIENVGDYPAYIDQDVTRGIYLDSGNSFSGFWDATTVKWYGVVGYMCIPS